MEPTEDPDALFQRTLELYRERRRALEAELAMVNARIQAMESTAGSSRGSQATAAAGFTIPDHPPYPWATMDVNKTFRIYAGTTASARVAARKATRREAPKQFRAQRVGDEIHIIRTA